MRILFVCMGNICRSPTAEGVMRRLVADAGLQGSVELDSAGTGGWHVGEPPDARATAAARRRGIALEGRARQVRSEDFERFDLVVAMDRANARALRALAPDERARAKIHLLREFDPASANLDELDVPDPYYDGAHGFDVVLDQVQAACAGLLEHVRAAGERGRARRSPGDRRQGEEERSRQSAGTASAPPPPSARRPDEDRR